MTPAQKEQAAREICLLERVDPDQPCIGLGIRIPLGKTISAWELRLENVEIVLRNLGR